MAGEKNPAWKGGHSVNARAKFWATRSGKLYAQKLGVILQTKVGLSYFLLQSNMKNFSLTQSGILVAVAGTLLTQIGFSDICSNEIVANIPLVIGGVMAWIGRVRAGGINIFGFRTHSERL